MLPGIIPMPFMKTVPAVYQGPGDVKSGAFAFWGTRAYTLAAIGTKALQLYQSPNAVYQDINTVAGGGLDIAAITTFKGTGTISVAKFYDQSGNARDLPASGGGFPALTLSGLGSLPTVDYSLLGGTTACLLQLATISLTEPNTVSMVMNQTPSNTTIIGFPFLDNINGNGMCWFASDTDYKTALGFGFASVATTTATTWYAAQHVFNGASSDIYLNGSSNTFNTSGNMIFSSNFSVGARSNGQYFTGKIQEVGIWGSAFSSGEKAAMNSNQRSYYGI